MPRRLPLPLLLLLLAGCVPSTPFSTLSTRPSGKYGETRVWEARSADDGPEHRVRVSYEVDPAQLMGWAKKTRPYFASVVVAAEGPEGRRVEQTVTMPVTEQRKVGEVDGVVQVAYDAAGEALENGFFRVPARDAVSFSPRAGTWTLSATLKTPSNADKRAVGAIRVLHLELLAADRPGRLDGWSELPPRSAD